MALKDILDKDIQQTLSKDEKNFYGLSEKFQQEQNKTTSTFSSKAFGIIQSTIINAENSTIDELQIRIQRLTNLKKYTKEAKLGQEEEQIILDNIQVAEDALRKQLRYKKSLFNRAGKSIASAGLNVGAAAIALSGGDPLVALGVKLLGDVFQGRKERKLRKQQEKRETFRGDIESLKDIQEEPIDSSPEYGPTTTETPPFESTPEQTQPLSRISDGRDRIYDILQDIFLFTEEISDDVKKLIKIQEQNAFDVLESQMEGLRRDKDTNILKSPISTQSIQNQQQSFLSRIFDSLGIMTGIKLSTLIPFVMRNGLIFGVAGALLYGASDIILSRFKTGAFGSSSTEKLIKGVDDFAFNIIKSIGSGSEEGAKAGRVVPIVGTLIGGIIGRLLAKISEDIDPNEFPDEFAKTPLERTFTTIYDSIFAVFKDINDWVYDLKRDLIELNPFLSDDERSKAISELERQRRKTNTEYAPIAEIPRNQIDREIEKLDIEKKYDISRLRQTISALEDELPYMSKGIEKTQRIQKIDQLKNQEKLIEKEYNQKLYEMTKRFAEQGTKNTKIIRVKKQVSQENNQNDTFIRTRISKKQNNGKASSAYGPVQITRDLAKGSLENGLFDGDPEIKSWVQNKFIPQGTKFLNAREDDPIYGLGGRGDLSGIADQEKYHRMAAILAEEHIKRAGGDLQKAAELWRFGPQQGYDPTYFNKFQSQLSKENDSGTTSFLSSIAVAETGKPLTIADYNPVQKTVPTMLASSDQGMMTYIDQRQNNVQNINQQSNSSSLEQGIPKIFTGGTSPAAAFGK